MLFSGTILPEERFDRLAVDHLRAHGNLKLFAQVTEQLFLRQHAYRLELRASRISPACGTPGKSPT